MRLFLGNDVSSLYFQTIKSISKVLNLKRRSAGGFIWRFKKD
jgi:hypothetical protein